MIKRDTDDMPWIDLCELLILTMTVMIVTIFNNRR